MYQLSAIEWASSCLKPAAVCLHLPVESHKIIYDYRTKTKTNSILAGNRSAYYYSLITQFIGFKTLCHSISKQLANSVDDVMPSCRRIRRLEQHCLILGWILDILMNFVFFDKSHERRNWQAVLIFIMSAKTVIRQLVSPDHVTYGRICSGVKTIKHGNRYLPSASENH